MKHFFSNYQNELILTLVVITIVLILRYILHAALRKIGRKSGINEARINLINRYAIVTLVLIALLIEAFIFGAEPKDLSLVFSSVFAVIEGMKDDAIPNFDFVRMCSQI